MWPIAEALFRKTCGTYESRVVARGQCLLRTPARFTGRSARKTCRVDLEQQLVANATEHTRMRPFIGTPSGRSAARISRSSSWSTPAVHIRMWHIAAALFRKTYGTYESRAVACGQCLQRTPECGCSRGSRAAAHGQRSSAHQYASDRTALRTSWISRSSTHQYASDCGSSVPEDVPRGSRAAAQSGPALETNGKPCRSIGTFARRRARRRTWRGPKISWQTVSASQLNPSRSLDGGPRRKRCSRNYRSSFWSLRHSIRPVVSSGYWMVRRSIRRT